jgi:hypothetical protein
VSLSTLPPTWTPIPSSTPLPTDTPRPVEDVSPNLGTIYYIYNGDSVIAVAVDGSRQEFILNFATISYLTPSPDGELLAFIAPGSGSAYEVWIRP